MGTVLVLGHVGPVHATEPNVDAILAESVQGWHQRHWTVEEGLPVNALTDIVTTPDGWLWIGSYDGLLRFDGHRIRRFGALNEPALRSNRIDDLAVSSDGTLWIRSEYGHLTRYRDGRFTAIEPEPGERGPLTRLQLASSLREELWLGSNRGLFRVVHNRIVRALPTLAGTGIAVLHAGSEGRLWWVTEDHRLGVLDGGDLRWIETPSVRALVGNPERKIHHLVETEDGGLWLGSSHGLFRLRADHTLKRHQIALSECPRTGLLWYEDAQRRSCAFGPDGAVWAVHGQRLLRDGETMLILDRPSPSSFMGLAFDREGTLWTATNSIGLYNLASPRVRVLGEAQGLAGRNIYPVYQDPSGTVWTGDWRGGLSRVTGAKVEALPSPSAPEDCVYSIYFDLLTDQLLFGALHGLYVLEPTGRRRRLSDPAVEGTPPPIRSNVIRRLRDQRLLVGTERGSWVSHPGDPGPDGWRGQPIPGVDDVPVRAVAEAPDGAVWLATAGTGLVRWQDDQVVWFGRDDGLPSDFLRSLYRDGDGDLWIGTEDRGLARLRPGVGSRVSRIDVVDRSRGLWDDGIHAIIEDGDGRLWMSSNRGVFYVSRELIEDYFAGRRRDVESVAFTEADGMLNREGNGGGDNAGLLGRDGQLWFATQNGVAIFDPAEVGRTRAEDQAPPVFVEHVSVGEDRIELDGGGLTLSPAQRSFAVAYTALAFRAPERVRFRYRLEGYDPTWIEAGDRRQAFFTKVPPGTYSFHVQARSGDGVWNRQGATLTLVVRPFLWETTWLRTLAVMVMVAVAFGTLRARERQQRLRRERLETQVAERTAALASERDVVVRQAEKLKRLDRQKTELFAEVSHELRTPLTLTLGPLQDLRDGCFGALPPSAREELGRIHGNAARLKELVDQVLDVARFEAGGIEVRATRQDLGAFVERLCERFVALAERQQLDYQIHVPSAPVWLYLDPEHLDRIVTNLLSNAFKLTPRGGAIDVVVRTDEETAELVVADTGPGIDAAEQTQIFDRFYRSGAQRQHHLGTGLGLSLVRDLVELHGGRVEVKSDLGEGASFLVRLPIGRQHLLDHQIADTPVTPATSLERAADNLPVSVLAVDAAKIGNGDDPMTNEPSTHTVEDRTTVLVVDDHPGLRAYLRRHLERRYRVIEAAEAATALEVARAELPDLVISDVMMPPREEPPPSLDAPEDGVELCRALKRDRELGWMPVVLLTARATSDDKIEGLVEGADDYLFKPFDVRELAARVDNLITSRRALRQRFLQGEETLPTGAPLPLAPQVTATLSDRVWLRRVLETMEQGLDEEDFTIEALADRLNVHRSRLHRRLKALTDRSPSQLLMALRVERSASLLKTRAAGVAEIGYAVGFQSAAHFSRRFKERYGISPMAFQRQALLDRAKS